MEESPRQLRRRLRHPGDDTTDNFPRAGDPGGAANYADHYGTRIRGYIVPPTTGNYTFWIASDDQSELWISTDDQPANLVKRAYVLTYTGWKQWTVEPNQKSPILALTAGQEYYFEAIQRDYSGGDNMAVGWFKPGDAGAGTPPSQVVPGSALAPYTPPAAPAGQTTLYFAVLFRKAPCKATASWFVHSSP